MATLKKTVVKKATKKAQYGSYLEQDNKTGKYTRTTKSNTPEGPRYYQYTHPIESTTQMLNDARARANSADSTKAKDIDPYILKKLANQKNGGKVTKKPMKSGGMIKRADGHYSKRGLWDNIRANKGSGKKPTPQMLKQEKKIKAKSK
jgi:hypothetical protein